MTPSLPTEQTPQPLAPQQVDLETPEQKYARLYSGPPQVPQSPQPVPQPQPTQFTLPPEVTQTLDALRNEMAELRSRTPQPTPTPQVPSTAWVDKIRDGDFAGAEKAIADAVEARLTGQITSKAYQDALAATQVQLDIDRHITAVKLANPDIARFERYLQAPVNARVEAAKAAGRIRSSEDFTREYKAAVDAEVLELRNVSLQYRADGKQEAMTRQTAVSNAFTPPPQQTGDHISQPSLPGQLGEGNDDYFARRKASEDRLHGRF